MEDEEADEMSEQQSTQTTLYCPPIFHQISVWQFLTNVPRIL